MIRHIGLIVIIIVSCFSLSAQDDPVLFSVGNTPVHVSEFEYIYTKTNGEDASFEEESLKEYLDLYVNFKLQVEKARDLEIDTIKVLQQELAGYRRQLSKNYLMDREVMEKLLRETYDRLQKDVSISHILVKVANNAAPKDTLIAYTKIKAIEKELEAGKRFGEVAKKRSEDGSTAADGGKIGFITALQLPGFYSLESAAYHTEVGKVSSPVRSRLGYHLVRVDEVRPARGKIELAHILARVNDKRTEEAKAQSKINGVFRQLQSGKEFDALAKTESEDEQNKNKAGYIGFVGIGQYEAAFEESAFGINADGAYSRPFRSSVGWHVLKRISLKGIEPYEDLKGRLQNRIRRDSRYNIAQEKLVERIKTESSYKTSTKTKADFMKGLDKSFNTFQWKSPTEGLNNMLYTLDGKTYTLGNFADYLKKNSNERTRMGRSNTPQVVAETLFDKYVSEEILKYEESRLEIKYPEFKALMREYQEGILLFEVKKQMVWDRASKDTVGLAAFYENNKNKYKWPERVKGSIYTVTTKDPKVLKKLLKYMKKKSPAKVLKKFNKRQKIVTVLTDVYEKGKNNKIDALVWKDGMLSSEWKEEGMSQYVKIEKVIAPQPKSLKEARGYVVADYQDYLQDAWLVELKKSYNVKINDAAFKKLVK